MTVIRYANMNPVNNFCFLSVAVKMDLVQEIA